MLYNPTGGRAIRKDKAGLGDFRARRGSRLHAGEDYLCQPGQSIFAPMDGILTRSLYVYPRDYMWKGLEIADTFTRGLCVRLLYVEVLEHKIGTRVVKGERVGRAQDISLRYPDQGMKPHVHMDIVVDPNHTYRHKGKLFLSPRVLGVGVPQGGEL